MMQKKRALIVGSSSIDNISGYCDFENGIVSVCLHRLNQDLPSSAIDNPLVLENGKTLFVFSDRVEKTFAMSGSVIVHKIFADSNDAFVCTEPLETDFDRIEDLEFSIHGADELFFDPQYEKLIASDPMNSKLCVLELELKEFKLTLFRRYSFGPSRVPRFEDYRARMEFREPTATKTARDAIARLRSCLSFFVGAYVTSSDFMIYHSSSKSQGAGTTQSIEWFNGLTDDKPENSHSAPLLMLRNVSDKETFRKNLLRWFSASEKWQKFFVGHLNALANVNIVSPEVLLNVCRWMEDHPNTIEREAIDKDEVANLIMLIKDNLSNEATKERAISALAYLKKEGTRAFFERLIENCPERLTANGKITKSLIKARSLRGTHAHSNSIDINFLELEECVSAVQTLCNWLCPFELETEVFSRATSTFHPISAYANFTAFCGK